MYKNKASVSVIIPAFNSAMCIERAIQSAICQKPEPLEVIVINDGSTDNTSDVCRSFGSKIHLINQINKGQGAARNAGLKCARGEFITFLDADDYWLQGFLKTTVDFLNSNRQAIAVSTGWEYTSLGGRKISFPPVNSKNQIPSRACILENFFEFWGKFDHVRTGSVTIRHSIIKLAGYQQPKLRISQDLEYWGYLATFGLWGFIPEILWVGGSIEQAAKSGWITKYQSRRKLCPTVEEWQERICSRIKDKEMGGFRLVRGRIAAGYAHSMIMAMRYSDARKVLLNYAAEMPPSWSSRLLRLGHKFGQIGWNIACIILLLREYIKASLLKIIPIR